MSDLCIEISLDDRPLAGGGTVVGVNPEARRLKGWLYQDGQERPRFVGEGFLEQLEIETLLTALPLLQFVAGQMNCVLSFSGLVPQVAPHPKLGKAMMVLKLFAAKFG